MDLLQQLTHFHDASGFLLRYHHEHIESFGSESPWYNPLDELTPSALASPYELVYAGSPEGVYGAVIKLPDSSYYLTIGPVFFSEMTPARCEKVIKSIDLPIDSSLRPNMIHWLQSFPLSTLLRFTGFIKLVYFTLFSIEVEAVTMEWPKSPFHDYSARPTPVYFEGSKASYEKILLTNIEYGNIHEAKAYIDRLEMNKRPQIDRISGLRHYQTEFIKSAALASRAAIRGGLNYALSLSISDMYIKKMFDLKTANEILISMRHMLMDFVYRTAMNKNLTIRSDSIIVKRINSIVQEKLFEQLSTSDIAEALDMTSSYISKHFKDETGITITQYIQEKKITEAKRLLQTSDLLIHDIATMLDYSSQSYFNQVFKKTTGMTPIAFKNHS